MSDMPRRDLTIRSWYERRTFRSDDFTEEQLLRSKGSQSVSILLPAREVASTIGEVVRCSVSLQQAGLVDEVVVIDSDSQDGTADIAEEAGATVRQRSQLMKAYGAPLGKGDGIWRGLSATSGDVVVLLDTDTQNFGPHFITGLLGPLLTDPDIHLVKGAFERPLHLGEITISREGGRVTELVARPLLNMFIPQLAGFVQPLAGEVAGRRSLLASLPIATGYGIEIALLIDAMRAVGLDGLAQVDLGTRIDSGQPLKELSAMAYTVAATILDRATDEALRNRDHQILLPTTDGLDEREITLRERPPLKKVAEGKAAEA